MKRIRIGKRVGIRWKVTTNGEDASLEGRSLRLYVRIGCSRPIPLAHSIVDKNVVAASFAGTTQKFLGVYSLTLYEDYGKESQNVVDHCDAFELVPCTCEETDNDLSNVEIIVEDTDFLVGIEGLNAYEVALRDKVTNAAGEVIQSKEDWYAWLREPATLAAVEWNKTFSEIASEEEKRKEAELARQKAENIRIANENKRIAAEMKRQLDFQQMQDTITSLKYEVDKLKKLNYLILQPEQIILQNKQIKHYGIR